MKGRNEVVTKLTAMQAKKARVLRPGKNFKFQISNFKFPNNSSSAVEIPIEKVRVRDIKS